ncbi:MAG: hypothetical protein NTX44_02230 [Ignavibacteriales bacterium]|nr:hypothetical protein [Ignavibacteriales bacterium]
MKTLNCNYRLLALIFSIMYTGISFSQTTPQPTQVLGTNRIDFSTDSSSVTFWFEDIPLYKYENQRGTFDGLSASANGQSYFHPAKCGGVLVSDHQEILTPLNNELTYLLKNRIIDKDSVAFLWTIYNQRNSLYSYWMKFHIKGRTLIIDIVGTDDNDPMGSGITLGYAKSSENSVFVVPVPYLTLTNLLYEKNSSSFTSMFFDWERTNCSRMYPLTKSLTDSAYAQRVDYFPNTDGTRHRIQERIYLTTSQDVNEVMPNVVGPIAPHKDKMQDKIVVSFQPPFPWILKPWLGDNSLSCYLDSLGKLGITNIALLIKDWWWSGDDAGNPNVLPANDYIGGNDACPHLEWQSWGGGGNEVMKNIRDKAHQHGFTFALHQNYVDMYFKYRTGAEILIQVDSTCVSKLPNNKFAMAFGPNCNSEFAYAIKPSRILDIGTRVSAAIYHNYGADWSYLDVTSSTSPSGPLMGDESKSYVDFDKSLGENSGKFLYTLRNYRRIPDILRKQTNNGPTQGEGGNHFLYAGYFDDFEARIYTAVPNPPGQSQSRNKSYYDNYYNGYHAPLFIDFHLNKLRSKSSYHGAGHIYDFYGSLLDTSFSEKQLLPFIATELAYGHGGLVTKSASDWQDHSLKQIILEYRHVLPMQKLLTDAKPVSIMYYDSIGIAKTASQYIADHPNEFADIHSKDFMGRVRIEYDHGVVVYINRSPDSAGNWIIRGLFPHGWYNYNIILGGVLTQGVGVKPSEPMILPPECGWICYSPK